VENLCAYSGLARRILDSMSRRLSNTSNNPCETLAQAQSRHKSLDVLSGYVRSQELFEDHAGEVLLTSKKSDDGS
jgi:hypothetical protein